MRRLSWLGIGLGLVACGDDTVPGGDTDTTGATTTVGTTTLTTSAGTTFETDVTTDAPTTTGDGTGSTGGSSGVAESSSTGEPNTDPEAADDYYLTNTMADPLDIAAVDGVLANDTDADGDPLTIDTFDAASEEGGVVDMMDDGSFTYTRPDAFFGEDRFSYTTIDGAGGMSTAQVRVMVAPTTEPLGNVSDAERGFAINSDGAGTRIGISVRGTGDVNGDGLLDVVVGAERAASNAGAAYVVFGKNDSDAVQAGALGAGGFEIAAGATDEGVGYSVAVVGDVNGDGLADIAVGQFGGAAEGRVGVVFGKADTASVDLDSLGAGGFLIADGLLTEGDLGFSVGGAGDVNGDGLADVIVGAPYSGIGSAGTAYVVFGKTDTTQIAVGDFSVAGGGIAIVSETANAHLGWSVSGAGDVNGDGLDDVIAGAPDFMGQTGIAAVVLGKNSDTNSVTQTDLLAGTGGYLITGAVNLDDMGLSVDGVGDVNGDGLADVALGAPGADVDKGTAQGRAYVAFGKADTLPVDISALGLGTGGFILNGEADFDLAGWSVGGGGDINGDGYDDLLVGAQGADFAAGTAGRAYAVFGKGDDTTPVALSDIALGLGGFALDGEGMTATAGWSVDTVGDVNGDGYSDLIVGSPRYFTNTGRAHVVFGGDYLGLVPVAGTAGADVLVGVAGADLFVTGSGDDEVDGAGGADVLYLGPGDDVAVLSATDFARIDGGTGSDTVRLAGGVALDLTNYFEVSFVGIEVLDLGVDGDNQLFMELRDLRAMSPDSNTLRVTGDDDGDSAVIDLSLGSFVDQGSAGGFTTYSDGVLTVEVSDDIESFVSL